MFFNSDSVETNTIGEITVTDTGSGIDPSEMSMVFQPFSQIDSSYFREYAGKKHFFQNFKTFKFFTRNIFFIEFVPIF